MPEILERIAQQLLVLAEQDEQPEVKAGAYAGLYFFTRTGDFVEQLQQALILAMHDLSRDISLAAKRSASALIYGILPWTTPRNPRRQEVALRAGLFFLENQPGSDTYYTADALFSALSLWGYSSQLYQRVRRTALHGKEPRPVMEDPDVPPEEAIVPFPTFHSVRFLLGRDVLQQLGFGDRTFERKGIPVEDLAGLLLWLETERMALPDEQPPDGPLSAEPFALDLLRRIQRGDLQVRLQEDSNWNWSQRFPQDQVTVSMSFSPAAGLEGGWIEKAVAVVDRYMAQPEIASVIPLVQDKGQPLNVTASFSALQAKLKEEGIAPGDVYRIPPAFFQSAALPSRALPVHLDREAAWAEGVKEQLEQVVADGKPLIEVVEDVESARIVVAERDIPINPEKQTLIRVRPANVQSAVALVTPALFVHLERSGLLTPGAVVYLYQGDPDQDVYLFA